MFRNKIVDILEKVQVFEELTKDDLKLVSKHCQKVTFQKGESIIQVGKRSRALHILVKGELKVFLPDRLNDQTVRRGSEVILNRLKAGDYFGEYSLINKTSASASIVAVESGELLKVSEPDFSQIVANDRIGRLVYHNMLRTLIKRLKEKEKELDLVLIAH